MPSPLVGERHFKKIRDKRERKKKIFSKLRRK
jgi:hypothetical protein